MASNGVRPGWLVPLLLLGVTGCYHYVPMHLDEVTPSQEVRARVTLEQAERIEELLPRGGDPRVVEGRVAEILRETLYMDVAVATELRGTRVESFNQRLDLPLSGILEVERKELSRGRTVALVAGGVALVGSFVAIKVIDSGGGGSPGEGPGPPENRIPIPIPLRP
jgi:hypothetical protein